MDPGRKLRQLRSAPRSAGMTAYAGFLCPASSSSLQRCSQFAEKQCCRQRSGTTGGRRILQCTAAVSSMARLRVEIKTVAGEERGLFGLEEEERDSLETVIRAVEKENPTLEPTANNAKAVAGSWRLMYTNLEILGRKRVRLAIGNSRKPGFVRLGEFLQVVDPPRKESKSVVEFKIVTGGTGTFTISAGYDAVNSNRVKVVTTSTALEPASLEKLLGENKALLTEIFNPEGYLDITYVDESLRIGRDNKGHVFVLERIEASALP